MLHTKEPPLSPCNKINKASELNLDLSSPLRRARLTTLGPKTLAKLDPTKPYYKIYVNNFCARKNAFTILERNLSLQAFAHRGGKKIINNAGLLMMSSLLASGLAKQLGQNFVCPLIGCSVDNFDIRALYSV